MMGITHWIPENWLKPLGWTVLHSFWQATAVAVAVLLILRFFPRWPASRRYWVAMIGLWSIPVWSALTFIRYFEPAQQANSSITLLLGPVGSVENAATGFFHQFKFEFVQYFQTHLPLIVSFWLLGFAFFGLRLLAGIAYTHRLKFWRTGPVPETWNDRFDQLWRRMQGGRRPKLLQSAAVAVPMVIGWWKPVILMPVGLINSLTIEEVEAVLAHELAHLARHDFLLNIIQSIIDTFYYFNPAVWQISAAIRTEREHCCDDKAIRYCGNPLFYAKTLVALQEAGAAPSGLAMTLFGRKKPLLNRIRRILKQPQKHSDMKEKSLVTFVLLALFCLTTALTNRFPAIMKDSGNGKAGSETAFAQMDTLPSGNTRLTINRPGESVDVEIRDGKIRRLEVDGKVIPEAEWKNYESKVEKWLQNVPPVPPIPPVPPMPPMPPMPPIPPVPPMPPLPEKGYLEALLPDAGNFWLGDLTFGELFPKGDMVQGLFGAGDLFTADLNLGDFTLPEMNFDNLSFFDGNFQFNGDSIPEDAARRYKEMVDRLEARNMELEKRLKEQTAQLELRHQEMDERLREQAERMAQRNREMEEQLRSRNREHEEQFAMRMDEQRKRLEENSQQMAERAAELEQRSREMAEEIRQREAELKLKMQEVEAQAKTFREFERKLESELSNDGFLKENSKYSIEISEDEFKVNGKKQSEDLHRKYLRLYENATGRKLTGKSKVTMENN